MSVVTTEFGRSINPEEPLMFDGFASGMPFLVENATSYCERVIGAAASLFKPPEGVDGYQERVLVSPYAALPVMLLHGDEQFNGDNRDALEYPLLYLPVNKPLSEDMDFNQYALALQAYQFMSGNMFFEPNSSPLLTGGVDTSKPFTVDEELWGEAMRWAGKAGGLLEKINLYRWVIFDPSDRLEADTPDSEAMRVDDENSDLVIDLLEGFNIRLQDEQQANQLSDDAMRAADKLYPMLEDMLPASYPFTPFQEFYTSSQEQQLQFK